MSYVFGAAGWVAFFGLMLVRKISPHSEDIKPSAEDYPII